jgi:hypothetical protein
VVIVASLIGERQSDGKTRPLLKFTIHLYSPSMLFNDAMGYGQSETGTTFPSGKKGIKDLTHIFLCYTFA